MPETIHCSICHKPIRVKDFADQMKKIREHRKEFHPKAFKSSIRKGIATRKRNAPKKGKYFSGVKVNLKGK
jgi:hypothetical protein